jgi:hypothetical protein
VSGHKYKIGEAFQYRIKNVNEPHERVAKENELRSA